MASVASPNKNRGEILSTSQRSASGSNTNTPSHKGYTTISSSSYNRNDTNTTSAMMINNMIHENTTYETIVEQIRNIILQNASTFISIYHRNNNMILYSSQMQQEILTTIQSIKQTLHAFTFIEDENEIIPKNESSNVATTTTIPTIDENTASVTESTIQSIQMFLLRSQQHKVRRRTLQQHGTLLVELLDIPNLMDICIKSSTSNTDPSSTSSSNDSTLYYDEALQIASFANTLERRHGCIKASINLNENNSGTKNTETNTSSSSNRIIFQIIQQIRVRQQDLRRHLLSRLRGSNYLHNRGSNHGTSTKSTSSTSMSECLEIITALRRLNAIDLESYSYQIQQQHQYSTDNNNSHSDNEKVANYLDQAHNMMEYQLQIAFLEARDVWLDSTSKPVGSVSDSDNIYVTNQMNNHNHTGNSETILDMIERYRTRMFEVATQFNAIFTPSPSISTRMASSSSKQNSISSNSNNSTQLLALWITRRVQYFLNILRQELSPSYSSNSTIDAATIRDAIEASVFFATSLGRLGADFTCQLSNIFEPLLVQVVTQYWKEGLEQFQHTLEICRDTGIAGPLATSIDDLLGVNLGIAGTTEMDEDQQPSVSLNEPQPPPKRLLSLPPMARLVNAILIGLNELRRCLLPGVFPTLRRYMKIDVIRVIQNQLQVNERMVLTPGFQGETAALRSIATTMISEFQDIIEPYLLGSLEASLGYSTTAVFHHQQLHDNLKRMRAVTVELENDTKNVATETDESEAPENDENVDTERPNEEVIANTEAIGQVDGTAGVAGEEKGECENPILVTKGASEEGL